MRPCWTQAITTPTLAPGPCLSCQSSPFACLQSAAGTAADKLRLALVWLLTCSSVPPEGECQQVEALLAAAGADMAAWSYVKRMRRLNLTGKQQQGSASVSEGLSGFGGAAQSQLTTLLGTTFGQGLSSLTKGQMGQGGRACLPAARQWVGCVWVFGGSRPLLACLVEVAQGSLACCAHALTGTHTVLTTCPPARSPACLPACRCEELASG